MVDIEDSFKSLSIQENKFKLNPSKYGMFVNLDCQLYIRKASGPSADRSTEISKRLQLRGSNWESRLCELLRSMRTESVVYEDCTNVHFENYLRNILNNRRNNKLIYYFYQPCMIVKEDMYPASLRAADGRIIPDFLQLRRASTNDPWILTVMDAKSSLTLKQSHQAQVAFYAYFIKCIFTAEIDAERMTMSAHGIIWLQPSTSNANLIEAQQQFQLKPWLQLLSMHLEVDLPAAFTSAIEDVPWHLNTKCASCPYIDDCKAPKPYGMDIRALPNISRGDSEYLQDVSRSYAQAQSQLRGAIVPVARAVKTLVDALRREKLVRAEQILGMTRSEGLLASVLEQHLVVRGHLYGALPRLFGQGASVYLSLHCDPATGLPFAFGIQACQDNGPLTMDVFEQAPWTIDAALLKAREEALLLSLLSSLHALLFGGALRSASPVMFYVWDGLEHFCLNQLLIKAVCGQFNSVLDSHASLRSSLYGIAVVLLNFPEQWHLPVPPTDISLEKQFQAVPRVCDVTQAYRALVHLPIPGFYSPSAIYACFARQHSAAEDISLENIERRWQTAGGEQFTEALCTRLAALRNAATYLHQQVTVQNPALLYNSAPAPLPASTAAAGTPTGDPLVERLLFLKQVNCLVRCDTARLRRIAAVNGSAGQLVRLRCLQQQGKIWHFVQVSGEEVSPSASSADFIKKFCLVRDDEVLVTQYCDYQHLSERNSCSNWNYRFVNIKEATGILGKEWKVSIEMKSATFLKPDALYILFEREVDMVLQKSNDSLRQASEHQVPGTFADVVENPNGWAGAAMLAAVSWEHLNNARVAVDNVYSSYLNLHPVDCPQAAVRPLTGVQANAFQKVLTERLTILWGPPGTGKTHFAAKCMLNLFEMFARCAKSETGLRVLVTATTHPAINEILHKFLTLRELALRIPHRRDTAGWAGDHLKVFKLDNKPSDAAEQIQGVHYTKSCNVVKKPRFSVLGATVWALYKDGKYKDAAAFREKFDLVVMDEASQMPVADALMPLCCLRGDGEGRLLVVGDTLQLPPIFAYKFGSPPAGVPAVQNSVLECLLRSDDNRAVDLAAVVEGQVPPPPRMIKLSENYRMNSVLSRFTSRLYGLDYEPSRTSRNSNGRWTVTRQAVHSQRTADLCRLLSGTVLDSEGRLPELLAVRLVPHHDCAQQNRHVSLTAAQLASTQPLQHIHAEAAFVAKLVDALAGSHASLDADSAAQRIFVCTPHNAQKSAVRAALASLQRAHWADIADTVERMQGQERDLVVICLGVLSKEVVDKEVDFLFSKPRLNVAISRAKQTCILLYTDVLTALNPVVIGSTEAYLAYEHLQAFIDAAAQYGKRIDVPVLL